MSTEKSAVATVLTVYGIETVQILKWVAITMILLQQYLPFTVLKLVDGDEVEFTNGELQQYLPFTVLKPFCYHLELLLARFVATVLTVYGIETNIMNVYQL